MLSTNKNFQLLNFPFHASHKVHNFTYGRLSIIVDMALVKVHLIFFAAQFEHFLLHKSIERELTKPRQDKYYKILHDHSDYGFHAQHEIWNKCRHKT